MTFRPQDGGVKCVTGSNYRGGGGAGVDWVVVRETALKQQEHPDPPFDFGRGVAHLVHNTSLLETHGYATDGHLAKQTG